MKILVEVAKNLEDSCLFEIESLISSQPKLLKSFLNKYYLLEINNGNLQKLKLSISIKKVYKLIDYDKDLFELLKKVKPKNNFYLMLKNISENKLKNILKFWENYHNVCGAVKNPECKYILLFNEEEKLYYLFEELFETERKNCLKRMPKYRPFKRSGVLNSELARLMVNFGKVNENSIVLDPFCGSGSIIIEALINNCKKIIGIDIDNEMLEGAKINIKFYNLPFENVELIHDDAIKTLKRFPDEYFDSIVTDPPYGLSTKVENANTSIELLINVVNEGSRILKQKGRFVFVVPDVLPIEKYIPKEYKILFTTSVYVHKSLTRKIVVLEKC